MKMSPQSLLYQFHSILLHHLSKKKILLHLPDKYAEQAILREQA